MELKVYHGNKRGVVRAFEKRKGIRVAWFDAKEVEAQGFFFAETHEDAVRFGANVGEYGLTVDRPLVCGHDVDLSHLAEVLLPLFSETDRDGWLVFRGINKDFYLQPDPAARNPEWPWEFVHTRSSDGALGLDWEVLDNADCVARMAELGYDSTMVYEPETTTLLSWFTTDAAKVCFLRDMAADNDEDEDRVHGGSGPRR